MEISCDRENSDEETLMEKIQTEKKFDYEENSDEEILKKILHIQILSKTKTT